MNADWEIVNIQGNQANSNKVHELTAEIIKLTDTVTDKNKSVISQLSQANQTTSGCIIRLM